MEYIVIGLCLIILLIVFKRFRNNKRAKRQREALYRLLENARLAEIECGCEDEYNTFKPKDIVVKKPKKAKAKKKVVKSKTTKKN